MPITVTETALKNSNAATARSMRRRRSDVVQGSCMTERMPAEYHVGRGDHTLLLDVSSLSSGPRSYLGNWRPAEWSGTLLRGANHAKNRRFSGSRHRMRRRFVESTKRSRGTDRASGSDRNVFQQDAGNFC